MLVSSTLSGLIGNIGSPTSNFPSDSGVTFRGRDRRGTGLELVEGAYRTIRLIEIADGGLLISLFPPLALP